MLSITTDYAKDVGDPSPYLRSIAEAGFSHLHWCHQWNTDFLYSRCEIAQIAAWLQELDLALTDLHSSAGEEKRWTSPREYERLAGVELVQNRIAMTARLGSDTIIMHAGGEPQEEGLREAFWAQLWKSLDELEPFAREHGVRIAIENGDFAVIRQVLARYGPDYVGLCYDSGHGNMVANGLDEAEALKDRLISIHLHDNDGARDSHQPLFTGTVDWERLARVLARSSYRKCVSMEIGIRNSGTDDEAAFLRKAFETGTTFAEMIAGRR